MTDTIAVTAPIAPQRPMREVWLITAGHALTPGIRRPSTCCCR